MGTNYYLVPAKNLANYWKENQEDCSNMTTFPAEKDLRESRVHLGKISHGWRFIVQGDYSLGIRSFFELCLFIRERLDCDWVIINEYNSLTEPEDFVKLVSSSLLAHNNHFDYLKNKGMVTEDDLLDNQDWSVCMGDFS